MIDQSVDWLREIFTQIDVSAWMLTASQFDVAHEGDIEAQYAVSNGLLGVRASLEQPLGVSQPRTYVAGLFDQPPGSVITPILLSAPDWLQYRITIDGVPCSMAAGDLLTHTRTLDLRRGVMRRSLRWRSPAGQILRLQTVRFVSLAQRALGVHITRIVTEQQSSLTLETYRDEPSAPLQQVERDSEMAIWRTTHKKHWLAMAQEQRLLLDDVPLRSRDDSHSTLWEWQSAAEQQATLLRCITIARTGSEATSRAAALAIRANLHAHDLATYYADHTRNWSERWQTSDMEVDDLVIQRALRFAIYHLTSAANPDDEHVSIGARALTGDGYHGHVFWDTEIFLLPFYIYTWPAAARAMLAYRFHSLPAARAKAARLGWRGAFYAWESADTGDEATPRGVIGPNGKELVFRVATDEVHISADIAYAVWQYWQVTGDDAFLRDMGAEIVLETARFWASRATCDEAGSYHILDVIGPDEYHNGVDDNAYTNGMAQWNLRRGVEVAAVIQKRFPIQWAALALRIALTAEELHEWGAIADQLVTGFDEQRGMYEQFAGFFALEEIDLTTFTPRTPYMDVALGQERVQQTQVIKQADVVMLMALLWNDVPARVRAANFHYYAPRCSQGSSLSPAMHALVAARIGEVELAECYFRQAAAVDLGNTMGNAASGVHIATLGGMWQVAALGFAGMCGDENGLHFNPHLPVSWGALRFNAQWHGQEVCVKVHSAPRSITITLKRGEEMAVSVGEQARSLHSGEAWSCRWDNKTQRWMDEA